MQTNDEYRPQTKPAAQTAPEAYRIDKIAIDAIIGIYDYEREARQKLLFSIEAQFIKPADHQALDRLIEGTIHDYCLEHQPLLLERMAYELGALLVEKLAGYKELSLVIEKPEAMPEAECSFVRVLFINL